MTILTLGMTADWSNIEQLLTEMDQGDLQSVAWSLDEAEKYLLKERGEDSLPVFLVRYLGTLVRTIAHRRKISIS